MEFEFGTNWATYSRFVGDVFGSALAAEGVFAFFLESGFLAILLFGWDRVGPKMHFFATLMVCLGAHFSAVWIVVANSWMQTPAGYHIVEAHGSMRAEITDFWAMVFNPSSMVRLSHTIIGCWLAASFLVISIGAYYLLKLRHPRFSRVSLKVGLSIAVISCILQAITGDMSGKVVAKHQPAKLAALEGLYVTQAGAPAYISGIPNNETRTIDYGIYVPKLLSFLAFGDFNAKVEGLDQVPREDWPRVSWVFQAYHLMLYMWGAMTLVAIGGLYKWWRGTLFHSTWWLRLMVVSVIFPQIANQVGWMSAEMGRYPWIVYNLLRISDGLSTSVTGSQILGSLIMFTVVYFFLFILFIYLLDHKIKTGPVDVDQEHPYHSIEHYVEELRK